MKQMDWDDLRYVLAVAKEGSLSGAARALGVNHATVLRRVDAFEAAMGIALFDRTARGYRIAPRRTRILEAIAGVEEAVFGVERATTATRSPLAGTVRVTSTDSLCASVLPGIVADFEAEAEGLVIELQAQNRHSDLARLDADIAVRPTSHLPAELSGVIAADMGFAVYAAPQGSDRWLEFTGARGATLLSRPPGPDGDDVTIGASSDSFLVLREMAAVGQGQTLLPCILGDGDPRLRRVEMAEDLDPVPLWVASHVDLLEVPRIKAVREMIVRALERNADALAGVSGSDAVGGPRPL